MSILAKDLAKQLNLSAATVSMVLNNKPGISKETRALVLEAAQKQGYRFKKKTAATETIQFVIYKKHGTIVGDTPFFSQMIEGITQKCQAENYSLQITYFYEQGDVAQQLESIHTSNCAGIILLGTEMQLEDFKYFDDFMVPVVLLDCYQDELNIDCVLINNVQGAFLATNYLIECGHKKIGYLQSSIRINNFVERADGYYKALRLKGMDIQHPYVVKIAPSVDAGYREIAEWLQTKPDLADAYFADNDIVGAVAVRAFQEVGYRVPENISVIGFDDMQVFQFLEPSLSTMRVPKMALGALAVSRLIEKIQGKSDEIVKIALSTQLIERDSTCHAAKG